MLGLITDREQSNVDRRNALAKKGWHGMTDAERAEWTGNIYTADLAGYTGAVNLLPYSGSAITVKNKTVVVPADCYWYIGSSTDFENKTVTVSAEEVIDGSLELRLCWSNGEAEIEHIDNLVGIGSKTISLGAAPEGATMLAMYITAGEFVGVMLEFGDTRHPYVPYTPALPTNARRGAYNYDDLKRIERAIEEISEELGMSAPQGNWTEWDMPKQADTERILLNIKHVRDVVGSLANTPDLPTSMRYLSYDKANNIEKVLSDAAKKLAVVPRAGDIFCNEV